MYLELPVSLLVAKSPLVSDAIKAYQRSVLFLKQLIIIISKVNLLFFDKELIVAILKKTLFSKKYNLNNKKETLVLLFSDTLRS